MKLLADFGNTRLKWAQSSDTGLANHGALSYNMDNIALSIESAMRSLEKPDEILVASVAGEEVSSAFEVFCQSRWSMRPRFVVVSEQLAGVSNGYESSHELGIDRWLAVVAAWQKYRMPVCVIDCGTALTIDLVDENACYVGGYIIPGVDLMIQSLSKNTQQINVSEIDSFSMTPGLRTVDCVVHGAIAASVSTIKLVLEQTRNNWCGDVRIIMTGGFAEEISAHLGENIDMDPWLVLHGLNLMAGDG